MENSNVDNTTERTTAPGQADATNSMPNTQSWDESWGHGTTSLRYFSMFSGIGGFELGIERAFMCIKNKGQSSVSSLGDTEGPGQQQSDPCSEGLSCVGFSEIDKYAIKIYESHFGGHKNYGDATRIVPEELPDFDLLVGGFPCQAFSIAGKRLGFEDTRGTLFFDIARILKVKRPRMFLLENVKGLLSHDNGRTFKTIITTLAELGYGVEWQVLNSKDFGVPQNRERVFIVGHLGDDGGRKVFPIGKDGGENLELRGQQSSANTLTSRYEGGANGTYVAERELDAQIKATQKLPDAQRIRLTGGASVTLKGLGGGQGAKTGLYAMKDMRVRRLTPVECERLQGYPDGWTAGVSDSQRYKTLGNSVTVNVIEAIMSRLLSLGDGGNGVA